jgi:tetratricopeptide (TPR) repeat protein
MDARRVGWIAAAVAGLLIGTSPAHANHGHHHHHHHHHHRGFHRGFFPGFFAPGFRYYRSYGYAYGIVPYYYPFGATYNFNLNLNLYAPPPAQVPAARLVKPRGARNAVGMNAALRAHAAGRAAARANAQPPLILRGDDEPEQFGDARDRRDANGESLARARRFIELGDARFREHHYHAALERYQDALKAAPMLADVYFRQGFAHTALGQYESAALAFERGLKLDPNRPQSDFNLSELFGDDPAPLIASRRRIAKAAAAEPRNGDLLFVLGVQLYFAGGRDRALPFFRKAEQLSPDDARLDPFLVPPGKSSE